MRGFNNGRTNFTTSGETYTLLNLTGSGVLNGLSFSSYGYDVSIQIDGGTIYRILIGGSTTFLNFRFNSSLIIKCNDGYAGIVYYRLD